MLKSTPTTGACLYPLLASMAIFCLTSDLSATPYTFTFEGVVTEVSDEWGAFDPSIVVGSSFVGSYTFNSAVTDAISDPGQGAYIYSVPAPGGMSMTVTIAGDQTFPSNSEGGGIGVWDHTVFPEGDGYQVGAWTDVMSPQDDNTFLELWVWGDTNMFESDALPLVPPDFADGSFTITHEPELDPSNVSYITGDITLLVPEPGTIGMLGIGALGLLVRRRRG